MPKNTTIMKRKHLFILLTSTIGMILGYGCTSTTTPVGLLPTLTPITLTSFSPIVTPTSVPTAASTTLLPTLAYPTFSIIAAPPTPTKDPSLIQFTGVRDQYAYKKVLDDSKNLKIPTTPLPLLSSSNQAYILLPTPTSHSGYLMELGSISRLDSYAVEVANYFKDHQQEGPKILKKWLEDHKLLCNDSNYDIEGKDYNHDGIRTEYILTLSLPLEEDLLTCNLQFNEFRVQAVYLMACQPGTPYCVINRIKLHESDYYQRSYINSIRDINNDGSFELFVQFHECGASDCYETLVIVDLNWHGIYQYLSQPISVHNGYIIASDENKDGVFEIYAGTSDFPGSLSGLSESGPFNNHVNIYEWDGTEYTLSGRAYTHECLFHVIWDGIDWAKQGEPQTALAVFEVAQKNSGIPLECKGSYDVPFPWRTYVQFATGILNAQLGEKDKAQISLLKAKELDVENIYTPLIDVFLKSYSEGYPAACTSLTNYINHQEDNTFRGPYSFRQLITFCPSDLVR